MDGIPLAAFLGAAAVVGFPFSCLLCEAGLSDGVELAGNPDWLDDGDAFPTDLFRATFAGVGFGVNSAEPCADWEAVLPTTGVFAEVVPVLLGSSVAGLSGTEGSRPARTSTARTGAVWLRDGALSSF